MKKKGKLDKLVIAYSSIALVCLILTFVVHWYWIAGSIVFMLLSQKRLFKTK